MLDTPQLHPRESEQGEGTGIIGTIRAMAQSAKKSAICRDGIVRGLPKVRTLEEVVSDFNSRIRKGSEDECWPWIGSIRDKRPLKNYGSFWALGKSYYSHRMAYELSNGPIPEGLNVLHKCDNPPCCNPNHLFIGTDKENMDDCFRKGRAKRERGVDRYNAKLNDQSAHQIMVLHEKGRTIVSLAREFSVSETAVRNVVKRKRWKHIGGVK